jgi:CelD/BcsL family acetyltransferase involved in cellulose biosynthesis
MVVVARDAAMRPVALLPLGTHRLAAWRIAVFLGAKETNLNLGLFRPDTTWTREHLVALLEQAARAPGANADAYVLINQPHEWNGRENPLAQLPHRPSPSFGAAGHLDRNSDGLALDLSIEAHKRLRKKARRLAGRFGPVRHVVARDGETARAILAAFHAQKAARMRTKSLRDVFAFPMVKAFLERATTERLADGKPGIELHALLAGERIVATFGGAGQQGRFSGMFNSFDMDMEIARSSPGELLLLNVIGAARAAGYESFDLGIGEAGYKAPYCDRVEPLFDSVVPITPAGRALGIAAGLARRAKRTIKQTPALWSLVHAARTLRRLGS